MSVYKLVKSIVLGKCLERLVLTTKSLISVSCISKIRFLSFRAIEWSSLSTNYDFPRHVFNKWISWSSVTSSLCCCNVSPVIAFSRGLLLDLINQGGGLYGKILTEVVGTDRTQ